MFIQALDPRYARGWRINQRFPQQRSTAVIRFKNHDALIYADAKSGHRLRLASGERLTEAKLGAHLSAYATPLFVFMTPQGEVIAHIPGFKTVEDCRNYDRYAHDGHYRERTLAQFLAGTRP